MDGLWGYYAKWNKSDRDKYHDLTYMWNHPKNKLIESRLVVARFEGWGKWVKGVKRHKLPGIRWISQFISVAQSCLTLCHPTDCSMLGLPVHHQLLEHAQTHVHRVSDAIQPSHPLSSPSPSAFSLSQHQGLFQWVSSSHQVAKVLEFQLQHQSLQWIFRTDFL